MKAKLANLVTERYQAVNKIAGLLTTKKLVQGIYPIIAYHAYCGFDHATVTGIVEPAVVKALEEEGYVVWPYENGITINWGDQQWCDNAGNNIKVTSEQYLRNRDELRQMLDGTEGAVGSDIGREE